MSKVRLKLPGRLQGVPTSVGLGRSGALVEATVRAEVDVGGARRDGLAGESALTDADEGDVLQLVWDGGIIELVRVGDLQEQFGAAVRSGANELTVPQFRPLRNPVRGEGALALERAQLISVHRGAGSLLESVPDSAVDAIAGRIIDSVTEKVTDLVLPPAIRKIEAERLPRPGLYVVNREGSLTEPCAAGSVEGGPHLVLIHGTFSSTAGAFKHLFGTEEWDQLYARYSSDGRKVLALEQRTVCDSPARNALELIKALAPGARLHLLSHSRGGLVGDLLCRPAWSEQDIEDGFVGERLEGVRQDLISLGEKLFVGGARSVQVERFLRVAAPAAGTQLAGKRLDQFLSVGLTLLGKLLDAGTGWFDFAKSIAVQIVSTRTRADACPGLEAMMPDSPFMRFLNLAESTGEELAVISGDVADARWFQLLKEVFADFYFRRRANDFIVDTASMTRGVARERVLQYRHRGPSADHFSYFQDHRIRQRVLSFLADGKREGYQLLERGTEVIPSRQRWLGEAKLENIEHRPQLPTVFVLPGIMGTRLGIGGEVIWVHLAALARGGLRRLLFSPSDGVAPSGLLEGYYQNLLRFLQRDFNVEHFGFDWRHSIKASAAELAKRIDEALDRAEKDAARSGMPPRPVSIIAHSMGGLVSRGLLAWHSATWDRLTKNGGRLVMLGTPNYGSYAPAQVFAEQFGLLQKIALIDRASKLAELTEVIKGFPGLIEMLPKRTWVASNGQARAVDWLESASWKASPRLAPDPALLKAARAVREELDQFPKGDAQKKALVYVAGQARRTPVQLELSNGTATFFSSGQGDATVPWELGLIDGVTTYYVGATHERLANHEDAFPGYLDLLKTGRTQRLARAPVRPVRERVTRQAQVGVPAPLERLEAAPVEPLYFPSSEDLLAGFIGSAGEEDAPPPSSLTVSVVNGHVQGSRHPIVVGHYEGDPIASVEGVLDRWLDGQLTRDHELRIYPGPLGSMRWYKRQSSDIDVIVVGLGQMGALTRLRLTETLREAFLRYAADRYRLAEQGHPLALELTSMLVGSWGKLTVEDSVCAVIAALREANQRLGASEARFVGYVGLEFMEIYRDLASQAAHVLQRLQDVDANLEILPYINTPGTFRRNRPAAHRGYYDRIAITSEHELDVWGRAGAPRGPDYFRFDVVTDLARSEIQRRCIQWSHIAQLLRRAPDGDKGAADTLFQYLVPWELRTRAREVSDLVLDLDVWTAQVPWELLTPESGEIDQLVRRGILRSLRVEDARPAQPAMSGLALVIGEPGGKDPPQPPLPGARAEAEEVARLLNAAGMATTTLLGADPDENFRALFAERYDIVHIAAHGHFDEMNPRHSGVVLSNERRLTACEFENLKATPTIVFLNCCHLGQVRLKEPGAWSASVARELIRVGVGVVVVAGWAVGDHAAVTFATMLYERLLSGETLMNAVRAARGATRNQTNGLDATWGAYQVYGDPGFSLPERARFNRAKAAVVAPRWVSPYELVEQVLDLEVRAGEEGEKEGGRLDGELARLWEITPKEWRDRGDVNSAFGKLYASLRNFGKAIEHYCKAIASSDAEARAFEQLANYEAREAARLITRQPEPLAAETLSKARRLFESSLRRLEHLIELCPSGERHAVRGATLKRLARSKTRVPEFRLGDQDESDATQELEKALAAYEASCLEAPADYPMVQVQWLRFCLGRDVDLERLQAILDAAPSVESSEGRILAAEIRLLQAVVAADSGPGPDWTSVQERARDIESRFVGVLQRQRDSSIDSLTTMIELCRDERARQWLERVGELLGIPPLTKTGAGAP